MANNQRSRERYGERFWRAHHEAWKQSSLNQREYCEVHDLSRKAFENWRAKFRSEPEPPERKLLYRRGRLNHRLSHTFSHGLSHDLAAPVPVVLPAREGRRRKSSEADKRQILADAIRYALTRWTDLGRFVDDGRIELDTNTVERAIRPIALGRKNHLFAGSDGGGARWATVCSLITTAKLNNVGPFSYLKDILQRMVDDHPASRLDELLPWNWKPITGKV